jgi:galactokinase
VKGDSFILHAPDLGQSCTFPLDNIEKDPAHPWADYFKGVAWSFFIRGLPLTPCEAVVTGDVPQGAGLSSSAAYEVAATLLFKTLGGFDLPSLEVAKIAREAENGFVGVNCGIMDQMTSVFSEKGGALLLDCRTLGREVVILPPGLRIVVVNTGLRHSLAVSEYNQRRLECEEGVKLLSKKLPDIRSLRDVGPEVITRENGELPPAIRKRCRHVVTENVRVFEAIKALRANDRERLKAVMLESHYSLRDDYEVSCPELDVLVELASVLSYCHGSRMTGAGFGGCTVNFVEADAVPFFERSMTSGYKTRTGRDAEIYIFEPSAGARLIDLKGAP